MYKQKTYYIRNVFIFSTFVFEFVIKQLDRAGGLKWQQAHSRCGHQYGCSPSIVHSTFSISHPYCDYNGIKHIFWEKKCYLNLNIRSRLTNKNQWGACRSSKSGWKDILYIYRWAWLCETCEYSMGLLWYYTSELLWSSQFKKHI